MTPWLAVVGIGQDGLCGLGAPARTLVETAELLVGGRRHLAMAEEVSGPERLVWDRPFAATIDRIAEWRGRRVVVLASGDPLWYGVGVALGRRFPRAEMTILPQPSAFSLAAAKLGWPLAECSMISLHGRPLDALRLHLSPGRRILALTDSGETPGAVAALLTRLGWGASRLTVLSHLGSPNEATDSDEARDWGERRAAELNTLAVECRPGKAARVLSRLAGLPDDIFENDGQLTKREIRAASLAALAPTSGETLWDIGAGCGSIAIEWLRATESCAAIAVERDPARAAMIARNASTLGVPGLQIVLGSAPAALAGLAAPDAVFVGGGLSHSGMLLALWAALRPGGRLVANAVTVRGETRLLEWHAQYGGALTRIAITRAAPADAHFLWRALAPVTQLAVIKPA